MKDPKNIDTLNELVITYMSLHGLQGMSMDQNNPFTVYYMMIMRGSIHSMETDDLVVPNSLVHPMVKYAYDFYKEVNEFNSMINPMMKEQVINVLGESEFDNFLESSVEKFKRCLFELINNYNSKKEGYNVIKISLLEDKMMEFVENEEYGKAAEMRDKLSELKK